MKNKYFSAAILYDERKNILTAMVMNIVVLGLFSYFYIKEPTSLISLKYTNDSTFVSFNFPLFILYISTITTVLVSYNNKQTKYFFTLTQPYSKDAMFITKTVGFILSYTIPLILSCLILIYLVIKNKELLGNNYSLAFSTLFLSIFSNFVLLTIIVMLLELIQMLFGKLVNTIMLPIGLAITSFISSLIIYIMISKKLTLLKNFLDYIISMFFGVNGFTLLSKHHKSLIITFGDYLLTNNIFISLMLLVISCLVFYICLILNRRIKAENTSGAFMFKFSEVITKFFSSLFTVTFGTMLILVLIELLSKKITGVSMSDLIIDKLGKKNAETFGDYALLLLNIAWIPMTIYAYKFINKFMKKRMVL